MEVPPIKDTFPTVEEAQEAQQFKHSDRWCLLTTELLPVAAAAEVDLRIPVEIGMAEAEAEVERDSAKQGLVDTQETPGLLLLQVQG
jgi:hypothetical protein